MIYFFSSGFDTKLNPFVFPKPNALGVGAAPLGVAAGEGAPKANVDGGLLPPNPNGLCCCCCGCPALPFILGDPNAKVGFEPSVALVGVELGVVELFAIADAFVFPKPNLGTVAAAAAPPPNAPLPPPNGEVGVEFCELEVFVLPNAKSDFGAAGEAPPPPKTPLGAPNENDGLLAPEGVVAAPPKVVVGAGEEVGVVGSAPLPNGDAGGLEALAEGAGEIPKLNDGGFGASAAFTSLFAFAPNAPPKEFD